MRLVIAVEATTLSRHCVLTEKGGNAKLQLGIWRVFDPWINPHLLVSQGYQLSHPERRPFNIEYHFRRVVKRLVISLARLNQCAREYDRFLEAGGLSGPNPGLVFEIPENAGIAADSVFHYLTLIVDDIARVIPHILTEDGDTVSEPSSFNVLKRRILTQHLRASQGMRDLFVALDQDNSWWSQGFKRGTGMRQRLTHYTDLVYFSGGAKSGHKELTSSMSLITIGGPSRVVDFESALQNLLADLCKWLDQLDRELLLRLSERLATKGIAWNPFDEPIPATMLPKSHDAPLDASHYLYLPVCSGQ